MLFEIAENFFLFFDLSTVVLCLLVSDSNFEMVALKLLLLALNLNTQVEIFLFKSSFILLERVCSYHGRVLLKHAILFIVDRGSKNFSNEVFAFLSEHIEFEL